MATHHFCWFVQASQDPTALMVSTQSSVSFWKPWNSGSSQTAGNGGTAGENPECADTKQPSWCESCVRVHLSSLRFLGELPSKSCEVAANTALIAHNAGKAAGDSWELDTVKALVVTRSCAMVCSSSAALSGIHMWSQW